MSGPSFVVVLPARWGSSRFPGKPLAGIGGKPLIQHVWERARAIEGAARVVVATDDERIAGCVRGFGGDVVMTSAEHATGTDRVAEVARSLDADVVVNLQGDEPVFDPRVVRRMLDALADGADIATACHPITRREEIESPHVVKVVVDAAGRALYFSRAPIPSGAPESGRALRHVGVYAFRRDALLRFAALPQTELETSEGLEQLRALENGMTVAVVLTDTITHGVDVPDDIKTVASRIAAQLD
jgi:3-deoxy-manno-octulosonate cytidylyltransferase (CMP-KDO synthetase)